MAVLIDSSRLRDSTTFEQETYLHSLRYDVNAEHITKHLLDNVASGSLPPPVLRVWFDIETTPAAIAAGINQQHSSFVRQTALQHLGRCFRKYHFEPTWAALGETEGCLQLLASMAVTEVKLFCRAIGSTKDTSQDRDIRESKVTELLQALFHTQFPGSRFQNPDTRPLQKLYARMLPACTPELCLGWTQNSKLPGVRAAELLATHPHHFRSAAIQKFTEKMDGDSIRYYSPLLQRFPERSSSTDGVSESMRFSLQILEYADQFKADPKVAPTFVENLILPLIRRLARRRVNVQVVSHALSLIIRYLEQEPSALEWLNDQNRSGFTSSVLQLWCRHPSNVEKALVNFVSTIPRAFGLDLSKVAPSRRYRLLAILLEYLPQYRTNIEGDGDWSIDISWRADWFLMMPAEPAASLLTKVIERSGQDPKIAYLSQRSIFAFRAPGSQSQNVDWKMLRFYLGRGNPLILKESEALLQSRKKAAEHCRAQQDRAQLVKWAIFTSISSGSLDLYADTLLWARRFTKDPLTVRSIYSKDTLYTREGLELLSGICARAASTDSVKAEVGKTHEIVIQLLLTACEALREPGFEFGTWYTIYSLWSAVVGKRMMYSDSVQARLRLADQDWYELVWQPTLRATLEIEKSALETRKDALHPLHAEPDPGYKPGPVVCRFIDELAEACDSLWIQHRKSVHPAVTVLPRPYTKAIPVQYSYSYALKDTLGGLRLPYISKRAAQVVFTSSADAFRSPPEDEESLEAIGSHVDDWKEALRLYVELADPASDCGERIRSAWEHATTELSVGHLSADEAVLYWRNIFREAKVEPPTQRLPEERFPMPIPLKNEMNQSMEWDPDPEAPNYRRKSRELPTTCLDSLFCRYVRHEVATEHRAPRRFTVRTSSYSYWGRSDFKERASIASRDAWIAAGLLCLQAKHNAPGPLFRRPFPGLADMRFPPVFLDQDFLDREHHDYRILRLLETLIEFIPPAILLDICNIAAAPLLKGDQISPEQLSTTMKLIKLLSRSDTPYLAADLISNIICSRPEDSSWHRCLLNSGFLIRLGAVQAKSLLLNLVDDICGILEKQAARPSNGQAQSQQPLVKISTVKMLAQLTRDTLAVSPGDALEILGRVLASARHLDIRVAAIESILDVLSSTKDPHIADLAFEQLRTTAVPVAAALNERRPLTEDDWAAAERENTVPEVYMQTSNSTWPGPVWETLLQAIHRNTWPAPYLYRLVHECLVPIISGSTANNIRWTNIFLRTHGFALREPLPDIPTKPRALARTFLFYDKDCPAHIFHQYHDYIKATMIQRDDLKSVVDAIQASAELRDSNAGAHFLSLWNPGFERLDSDGGRTGHFSAAAGFITGRLLSGHWSLENTTDLRPQMVVESIRDLTVTQLYHAGNVDLLESNDSFLKALRVHRGSSNAAAWAEHCKPLVQDLIPMFDSLRTQEWQLDSNRRPSLVPDTFQMRLWLLTYPNHPLGNDDVGRRRAVFAQEVGALINEIAGNVPYHQQLKQIRLAMDNEHPQEWPHVAISIGTLNEEVSSRATLATHLRIDLADDLLRGRDQLQWPSDVVEGVRTMLDGWTKSTTEAFRIRGIKAFAFLKRKGALADEGGREVARQRRKEGDDSMAEMMEFEMET